MSKIYVNQSWLQIILDTGVDISAASEFRIYYQKPDKSVAYVAAGLEGTQQVKYTMTTTSIFDASGYWKLWAWVKFADDREADGEPVKFMVYNVPS